MIAAPWATERLNRREMRAQALVSAIMHAIYPHIDPRGETDTRSISGAIMDLLTKRGVEVLTDYDRERVGLPPRDARGWTADEIIAYETALLNAMLRPAPTLLAPAPEGNTTSILPGRL